MTQTDKAKGQSGKLIVFMVGAVGYGLLECLWRGRTHWSMLLAGGLCFSMLTHIEQVCNKWRYLYRCVLGSGVITMIELIFGLIFNRLLHRNVWDYSHIRYNVAGQICLLYSVLWGFLTALVLPICHRLMDTLQRRERML